MLVVLRHSNMVTVTLSPLGIGPMRVGLDFHSNTPLLGYMSDEYDDAHNEDLPTLYTPLAQK